MLAEGTLETRTLPLTSEDEAVVGLLDGLMAPQNNVDPVDDNCTTTKRNDGKISILRDKHRRDSMGILKFLSGTAKWKFGD